MPTPTICAATLRDLRMAQDWTVAELAARSGIDTSVIYRLERGQTTRPYHRTVRLLAKALKVHTLDLLATDKAA